MGDLVGEGKAVTHVEGALAQATASSKEREGEGKKERMQKSRVIEIRRGLYMFISVTSMLASEVCVTCFGSEMDPLPKHAF